MVSEVMKQLRKDSRRTEADNREVEQRFQSMFGLSHEADLFLAVPQDGAI